MFHSLQQRLQRTPILFRIVIGNAIIIILGGILGTLLTHFLTNIAATLWHFVLFASIGIVISVVLNYTIVQLSLRPLRELRQTVNRLQSGRSEMRQLALGETDPDIHLLSTALNSLITQLETSNRQLRLLSERAISAQEEERKRIARSLHDDTGQALSTLIINLERLENHLPAENSELVSRLTSIRQMAADSLDCLRTIIYDLRPAILDDLGLLPAIRWYARTNLEAAGINVNLDFPDQLPGLPQPLTTTLFRVAQEGINNIIRHSQAKNTTISIGLQGNEVYLRLQDDGHGFDLQRINHAALDMQHWGLIGIQERLELVNGRMSISSDPEHGTTLMVSAPIVGMEVTSNG